MTPLACGIRSIWTTVAGSLLLWLLPASGPQAEVRAEPLHRILVSYPHEEIQPGGIYNLDKMPLDSYHFYSRYQRDADQASSGPGGLDRRQYEGIAGYVFVESTDGTVALYSLSKKARPFDNFLTTNLEEAKAAIAKYGYQWQQWDGTKGKGDDPNAGVPHAYLAATQLPGTIPLFRLQKGSHFYTIDATERDQSIAAGWTDEGIAGYVWESEVSGSVVDATSQGSSEQVLVGQTSQAPGDTRVSGGESHASNGATTSRASKPEDDGRQLVVIILLAILLITGGALVFVFWKSKSTTIRLPP